MVLAIPVSHPNLTFEIEKGDARPAWLLFADDRMSNLHIDSAAGDRRVALAVLVNLGPTAAQVIGGILADSLALIADATKDQIKSVMLADFGIGHSTLELECSAHACDDSQLYGHRSQT